MVNHPNRSKKAKGFFEQRFKYRVLAQGQKGTLGYVMATGSSEAYRKAALKHGPYIRVEQM